MRCAVSIWICCAGEFVVLLGPSGSGKSTLLNILGGLDVPTSGTVHYLDHELTALDDAALTRFRREHVGFVFQFYNLIPSLTARENVALITEIARNPMDPREALQLVGLAERMDHFPSQLSGGEQQRIAIARAIAKRPDVLLCDEPTGALDVHTGVVVLEAIERINRELGTTTAVITHNCSDWQHGGPRRAPVGRPRDARGGKRRAKCPRANCNGNDDVRALNRKAIRDLWHIKGQAIAIVLVVASGVGTFVMSLNTLQSLQQSRETYYERYRFADVFSHVKRAPLSLVPRVATIPGVAQAQPRIVVDVTLDVPDMAEPAIGRLISIPQYHVPILNDLHLRKGRWIDPYRPGEVLVSEAFADSHQLRMGDTVSAVINGKRQQLTVVGVALSPEYIIQIHGANLLPDDRRFGIFWMGYDQLAAAFNMDGAFNDITLTLMRGRQRTCGHRTAWTNCPNRTGPAVQATETNTYRTATFRTRSGSCAAWA